MAAWKVTGRRSLLFVLALLLAGAALDAAPVASAQAPTPTSPPTPLLGAEGGLETARKIFIIGQFVLDTLQGRQTAGAEVIFEQSKQSAANWLDGGVADIFFLDFGNPNLRLNQFAAEVARNLLALTPLYVVGYLAILVLNIWKERPIPNPIVYAALVSAVMIFLAAFAVITQGLSELGRALAVALGGAGDAMFARATLLDTILRILANLQKHGGILSILALLAALVEAVIILVQLAYRGLSMALWRLLGVLLIPLSVLLEGANPKTAGRVLSGFFESWLDMVGKVTLLLIVLALAASDAFAVYAWVVLPAGLLLVVLSWKFLGVLFVLLRAAVARGWANFAPAPATEAGAPLPAAAEAARAREVDEERRKLVEE